MEGRCGSVQVEVRGVRAVRAVRGGIQPERMLEAASNPQTSLARAKQKKTIQRQAQVNV